MADVALNDPRVMPNRQCSFRPLPTLETWIGDYASYVTFQESHHESCSSVQISGIQTGIERTLLLQSPAPKYARANSKEQIQIALGVG